MTSLLHSFVIANVLLAAAGPQEARSSETPSASVAATVFPAVTKPMHDLELAFPMAGRIEHLHVALGDSVAAGEVLAELENDDIDAQIALASLRASNVASVEAAKAELESAKDLLRRIERAYADNGANEKELLDARTRVVSVEAELVEAEQRIEEAKLEARQHEARLERSRLTAPFAGVVESLKVEQGGAVDELAAVMRIVDTSRLRIDVAVPVELADRVRLKDRLTVRYRDLALGAGELVATVTSLARVADAASRTRVIRLEAANPEGHPAGVPVEVTLPAAQSVAAVTR